MQEALIAAATQWPREGVPENPRAWLIHVASRRLTDQVRAEAARRRREAHRGQPGAAGGADRPRARTRTSATERDDTLDLLFMCCHPALVAVVGDRAHAARRRRLDDRRDRAARSWCPRRRWRSGSAARSRPSRPRACPSRCRPPSERAARLERRDARALSRSSTRATRRARGRSCSAAISRARRFGSRACSTASCPDDAEVAGLLALMLLTDARRAARTGPAGELIPLDEQDRTLWDRGRDRRGRRAHHGDAAARRGRPVPAAGRDRRGPRRGGERRRTRTGRRSSALYGVLQRMSDNPMVTLNHAIAPAMVHGPAAGLERLDALAADPRIAGHHRLDAVRAHLLERAGDRERRDRPLPSRRRAHHEHRGAELPADARGAPARGAALGTAPSRWRLPGRSRP